MRVIFMGTPDFSVPCLKAVIDSGHQVIAVVTQPDRPRGRGQKMQPSPVKIVAESHGINVLQPQKVREKGFIEKIRSLDPEIVVVVAFGQIIPKELLEMPPYGCINVHASLLPKYRGASPIQAALLAGDRRTGVTTMHMDVGLDTGDMIIRREITIEDEDNAGTLHDKLAALGADVLVDTLTQLVDGTAPREKQDDSQAVYAPKLQKKDGQIDWHKPALAIYNQVRALYPWPGSYTNFDGKQIKVLEVAVADVNSTGVPGEIVRLTDEGPVLQTTSGALLLKSVQIPGKRPMVGRDINNGLRLAAGDRFLVEAETSAKDTVNGK